MDFVRSQGASDAVMVQSDNGACEVTQTVTIQLVGVEELNASVEVPVKPNPTNGFFQIELTGMPSGIHTLAKINYHIHTDAIKENLIPKELSKTQTSLVYANEADLPTRPCSVPQPNNGVRPILMRKEI